MLSAAGQDAHVARTVMPDLRYEPTCFHCISNVVVLILSQACRDLAGALKASLRPGISEIPPGAENLCFVCTRREWAGSLTVRPGAKTWSPYL